MIIVGKCWLFNSNGFRNWAATHQPAGAERRVNCLSVPAAQSQERCCIVSFNLLISSDRFLQWQNFSAKSLGLLIRNRGSSELIFLYAKHIGIPLGSHKENHFLIN